MNSMLEYVVLKELALESLLLIHSDLNPIKDFRKSLILSSYFSAIEQDLLSIQQLKDSCLYLKNEMSDNS